MQPRPVQGGPAAGRQHPAEPVRRRRQELEREPQRGRRRPGPGALQADLAEVQLVRREVGVGRVVQVEAPDVRVGGTAPPRSRRAAARACAGRPPPSRTRRWPATAPRPGRPGLRARQQREETAVRGVDVDPDPVPRGPPRAPRAPGRWRPARSCPAVATTVPMSPRASRASSAPRSSRPASSTSTGGALDAEHAAHAGVGVVRLARCRRCRGRGAARGRRRGPPGSRSCRWWSGGPGGWPGRTSRPAAATASFSMRAGRRARRRARGCWG